MKIDFTPVLNFEEKYIKGSLDKCIRVMIHAKTTNTKKRKAYLFKNAKILRPDLLNNTKIKEK